MELLHSMSINYISSNNRANGPVVPIRREPSSHDLIDEFARRYANQTTVRLYRTQLRRLFADTGRHDPTELTEADVLAWCGGHGRRLANNSVRQRLSMVSTFLRWCVREDHAHQSLVDALASSDNPLRRIPRLYGKVQSAYPAPWLSHEQAFVQLCGVCDADTDLGLRDQLVIRLGLCGIRSAEALALRQACRGCCILP